MDAPHIDKDQKRVVRVYAAFGVSLLLSLVPLGSAALISMVLGLGVLVVAYVLRTDAEHGSLLENHMSFIIRTIWIGSFIVLICMSVAAIYLFKMLDNTPLEPCINEILSIGQMGMMDSSSIEKFMGGECWTNYWRTNLYTFIVGGVIAAGPVLLYFAVRYVRGITRAMGGYRVASPKAWF